MPHRIEILTAETERGRRVIETVMAQSYAADRDAVPPKWAWARVVDGVPVSFILVDPDCSMAFPGGDVRYAFIRDVATRSDRRREGHFRAILTAACDALAAAGVPWVVTHGRAALYRPFGFDVFTHHSGIFITPGLIERRLGTEAPPGAEEALSVEAASHVKPDLLLVTEAAAGTLVEARGALQAAAHLARQRGKSQILFEHPPAPSYGSRYPIHPSPDTPLTSLARACGASVRLQGADPEGRAIPHADWIRVLDAPAFLRSVVPHLGIARPLPHGGVGVATEVGEVTIHTRDGELAIRDGVEAGGPVARWPGVALAQLVTGGQPAEVVCALHDTALPHQALDLLSALFPRRWRFTRNEDWTYAQ
jgi:hypothetical protein